MFVASSGTNSASCGTISAPCADSDYAINHGLRSGSPDWVLVRCGDTYTNHSLALNNIPGGNASGKNQNEPMVASNYDPNASNNPPVPDPTTCSARPVYKIDGTSTNGLTCLVGFSYVAFLGINCQAYTRDPTSVSFSTTDGQNNTFTGLLIPQQKSGTVLLEDVRIQFFSVGISSGSTIAPFPDALQVRRNQIIDNYPGNGENSGILSSTVQGGVNQWVFYQNIFDKNGWNTNANVIAWAAPSGFNHNIYIASDGVNGDPSTLGGPLTFDGNIVSNTSIVDNWRMTGNYTNNLWMLSQNGLNIHQPLSSPASIINKNVFLDTMVVGATSPGLAMGTESRYINEEINIGTATWTQNIIANGPKVPAASGIFFNTPTNNSAANGNTLTGNYVYNWGYGAGGVPFQTTTAGGVCGVSISAAGTGYTDKSMSITGAAAAGSAAVGPWAGSSSNYVMLTVASTNSLPLTGPVYSTAGNLTGQYQDYVISATQVVLVGSSFNAGSTYVGTNNLFWGYPQVAMTGGSGTQFTSHIISAGGHIVSVWISGDDEPASAPLETYDDPGKNYVVGNVVGVPALGGTGSGGQLTVSSLCANNATSGNNFIDASGTNSNNWPDPNRTAGAYLATIAGTLGVSANSTFTGSIDANGVLTVASDPGTLSVGDAITWNAQAASAMLKGDANHANTLCSVSGATCTGNNGCTVNCTYFVAGAVNRTSISMSDWTTQQIITQMRNLSKQNWNTALTAPAVNSFIRAGFGIGTTAGSRSWIGRF